MLRINLKNAFEGREANNFTVLLLRLLAKADEDNTRKLRKVYPVEVLAVYIYKHDCPYKDDAKTEVDWEAIENRAVALGWDEAVGSKRHVKKDRQTQGWVDVILRRERSGN